MLYKLTVAFFVFSFFSLNQGIPLNNPDDVKLFVNKVFDASKNQNINQSFTVHKENNTIILDSVDIPDGDNVDIVKVLTKRDSTDNKDISENNDRKAELSLHDANNGSMNVVVVGGNKHVIDNNGDGISVSSSGGW